MDESVFSGSIAVGVTVWQVEKLAEYFSLWATIRELRCFRKRLSNKAAEGGERMISVSVFIFTMRFMKFLSVLLSACLGIASVGIVTTECHCAEKKACSRNRCCCAARAECCCKTQTSSSNVAAVGSFAKSPKRVLPVVLVSSIEARQGFQSNAFAFRISNLPLCFRPPALEAMRSIVLRI